MVKILIERLGAGGDGVDASGVFAPFTLPGETVRGEIVAGRMPTPEIIANSPSRASPPCRHFGACGGCALQHGSDGFLAGWKRDLIAAALAARGFGAVEIRETVTSPPRSRRRATFTARRTKKTTLAGFHERGSDGVVPIEMCELLRPELLAALPAAKAAARLGASRKGEIRATATLSDGGVDLSIADAKALDGPALAAAARLAEEHDLARLAWNGETVVTRRPPSHSFGAASATPPPGGFLQATREGEAALLGAVREAVGDARRIVDLFAGCGTFSLPLAEGAEVSAFEGEAASVAALDAAWRGAPGLKRVAATTRDLFRRPLLTDELAAFDSAVIDPPRAGAAAQTEELVKGGPARIAAVSCTPATFARDARALVDGGYRLDWVLPIDQFRWAPHVELAAHFVRA